MTAPAVHPTRDQEALVRRAGWALARHGFLHAYGHCSLRLDASSFLVSAAKPLGLVSADDPCVIVGLDGPLPAGVLGEVLIHREIYRRRPDVGGVVRCMPKKTMTLSVLRRTPEVRHGMGAYFAPRAVLWDDPQLVRSVEGATALAEQLGASRAIVMRGNGAVLAGTSLEEAVVLTYYLEDAAAIEIDCLASGLAPDAPILNADEAAARAVWSGGIMDRMWNFLTNEAVTDHPARPTR